MKNTKTYKQLEKPATLEVGDMINHHVDLGNYVILGLITRVTKRFAFVGGLKFSRLYGDSFYRVPKSRFGKEVYIVLREE